MGTREGEGCSTVVRDLAGTSATRLRESVLLLDLNRPVGEVGFACDANLQYHFEEICSEESTIEKSLYQLEQKNAFSMKSEIGVGIADGAEGEDLWLRVWNQSSLVLIDSPPATDSPVGSSHFKNVDGVVLVVREEKTRWPVAASTKEKITQEGGRVIGAVYNDRRYYIYTPVVV
jgi:protein-tyrosine kinase